MDSLLDWVSRRAGVPVDLDGEYGPQCMDLVNDYVKQVWGLGPLPGNAIDLPRVSVPGFHWIVNGPKNAPSPGSIVVWRGPDAVVGTSRYGHTAICLAAGSMVLLTFDQNWPTGHAPQLVLHHYRAVMGWWQPIQVVP